MKTQVSRGNLADVKTIRELYLRGLDCQMVHYSFLERGLSDICVARRDGNVIAYAGVSNKYDKGRLNEFYVCPEFASEASAIFREILGAGNATHIEAQTNSPLLLAMLREFGTDAKTEKLLFHDEFIPQLTCDGVFRKRVESDGPGMFGRPEETLAQWLVEADGKIVAAGGFLTHYNPPYADVFMEVAADARRRGYGSFLVQEIKKVCYVADKQPAARCDPKNLASRKTLEKAGMTPCGELLVAATRGR